LFLRALSTQSDLRRRRLDAKDNVNSGLREGGGTSRGSGCQTIENGLNFACKNIHSLLIAFWLAACDGIWTPAIENRSRKRACGCLGAKLAAKGDAREYLDIGAITHCDAAIAAPERVIQLV
jgi:hypothetical protein